MPSRLLRVVLFGVVAMIGTTSASADVVPWGGSRNPDYYDDDCDSGLFRWRSEGDQCLTLKKKQGHCRWFERAPYEFALSDNCRDDGDCLYCLDDETFMGRDDFDFKLEKAKRLLRSKKPEKAAQILRSLSDLAVEDECRRLFNLARAEARLGNFAEALRLNESAKFGRESSPCKLDHAIDFNQACYHALAGKKDKALEVLSSLAYGLREETLKTRRRYLKLAESDSDLDSLRKDPRFTKILKVLQETD